MSNPLIAIVVIAYNSSKTIIDTLESAKSQTYNNVELIISDDGSIDNTVEISQQWIINNEKRFSRVEIVTSLENTGVPANCNRALKSVSAEWIKMIAGDDILMDNCITDFVEYVNNDRNIEIAYSTYFSFFVKDSIVYREQLRPPKPFNHKFITTSNQLSVYLDEATNITPSLFYKRELIERMGCFNERYLLFEDTPIISKILANNIRIFFLDKPTVLYRTRVPSITRLSNFENSFYKQSFMVYYIQFRKEQVYSYYNKSDYSFWIREYSFLLLYYFTIYVLRNKRNPVTIIIYYLFKAINPYYLFKYIKDLL